VILQINSTFSGLSLHLRCIQTENIFRDAEKILRLLQSMPYTRAFTRRSTVRRPAMRRSTFRRSSVTAPVLPGWTFYESGPGTGVYNKGGTDYYYKRGPASAVVYVDRSGREVDYYDSFMDQ